MDGSGVSSAIENTSHIYAYESSRKLIFFFYALLTKNLQSQLHLELGVLIDIYRLEFCSKILQIRVQGEDYPSAPKNQII